MWTKKTAALSHQSGQICPFAQSQARGWSIEFDLNVCPLLLLSFAHQNFASFVPLLRSIFAIFDSSSVEPSWDGRLAKVPASDQIIRHKSCRNSTLRMGRNTKIKVRRPLGRVGTLQKNWLFLTLLARQLQRVSVVRWSVQRAGNLLKFPFPRSAHKDRKGDEKGKRASCRRCAKKTTLPHNYVRLQERLNSRKD